MYFETAKDQDLQVKDYQIKDYPFLLTHSKFEQRPENAILVTATYLVIKCMAKGGLSTTASDMSVAEAAINSHRVKEYRPMYKQTPWENTEGLSHDNLTAIYALSFFGRFPELMHDGFWADLKKRFFTIDSKNPTSFSPRYFLHPIDIIFCGIMADSWACWKLFPILKKAAIISARATTKKNKKNGKVELISSGKILWILKIFCLIKAYGHTHRSKDVYKFADEFSFEIHANPVFKGFDVVFDSWYQDPHHPIRKLAPGFSLWK